jgi:hypothetical protein
VPLEIESAAVNLKELPMSLFLRTRTAIAAATVLGLAGTIIGPAHAAATFTPWARVNSMQVGWVVDRMLVFHTHNDQSQWLSDHDERLHHQRNDADRKHPMQFSFGGQPA